MKSKEFTNKEEAKLFAKEHKGFYECVIDEELNAIWIVFYK